MIPVILSGGSGTRLWPVSRQNLPKQFCSIFDKSLQDKTFIRCRELGTPWLITSEKLKTLTERSLAGLGASEQTRVIYEPVGKNTAPAVAILCKVAQNLGLAHEVAGVFPSDHLISKEKIFENVVHFAAEVAATGKVVTLGITPSYAETGYGYIQTKAVKVQEKGAFKAYSVVKFHEKPTLDKAKEFISQQSFSWNAGIFIFKIEHMIELFKRHQPQMWDIVDQLSLDQSNLAQIYNSVQSISIDYAIMEKLSDQELACIPTDFGWNDVGSWDAVSDLIASQEIIEVKAEENFVFGDSKKSYSIIGASDLIVVDTEDAMLVINKGQSQDVRYVVEAISHSHPQLTKEHPYAYHSWGYSEKFKSSSSSSSGRFVVWPQKNWQTVSATSLLWSVTGGEGTLTLGGEKRVLKPGVQVVIPQNVTYTVSNDSSQDLEIFEVHSL